jgi:hypothetical protein
MNIKQFITDCKFKSAIAIIAAVVMYFTPDEVDHIIETLLAAYGITILATGESKETQITKTNVVKK